MITDNNWNRSKWIGLQADEPRLAMQLERKIREGYTPEFCQQAVERQTGYYLLAKDVRLAGEYLWREIHGDVLKATSVQ